MMAFVQRLGQICGAMLIVLWLVSPVVEWWGLLLGLAAVLAPVSWRDAPRIRLPRRKTVTPEPVDDPTEYLTDADRAWLAGHGWVSPAPTPAQPKRATWQTSLDREIARQAEPLRIRVENATRRNNAARIETGTNRRQAPKWLRE